MNGNLSREELGALYQVSSRYQPFEWRRGWTPMTDVKI